jgi:hypothetical protein
MNGREPDMTCGGWKRRDTARRLIRLERNRRPGPDDDPFGEVGENGIFYHRIRQDAAEGN